MSGLNKMSIIGHLGRDPEVRRTNAGDPVVNFSVAVSETWRDKATGDRRESTEWFNVVLWNEGLCKVAEQYLKKGSKVYLEGKIKSRKYTDKDGNERTAMELVLDRFGGTLLMLDGASSERREGSASSQREAPAKSGGGAPIDDEIPFAPEWRV